MKTRISALTVLALALAGVLAASPAKAAPQCDPALVAQAATEIADACPCAGKTNPAGEVVGWKNHGGYVSCVVRTRNAFAKQHDISKSCLRSTARCAARSTCGKREGFVVCRTLDACSDTTADGDPTGTCADDPTIACDTAADCPVLRCSVRSAADICEQQGGVAGTGSCCE